MAVPFIAADKPNERSEFSHADKAIVATTLAYYKQGLTPAQTAQLLAALEELLPEKRRSTYKCVLYLVLAAVCSAGKLDGRVLLVRDVAVKTANLQICMRKGTAERRHRSVV